MPRQSKNSRKSGKPRSPQGVKSDNPPVTALSYNGPWRCLSKTSPPPVVVDLTRSIPLTSSGTGTISSIVTADPTASVEWPSLQNLYQEYRVLAVTCRFVPSAHYFPTAGLTSTGVSIWFTTRDAGATPPANLDAALQYSDSQPFPGDMPVTITARMSGVGDASWYDTDGSPLPFFSYGIGVYGTQYPNTATVGFQFMTYHVQFRARA